MEVQPLMAPAEAGEHSEDIENTEERNDLDIDSRSTGGESKYEEFKNDFKRFTQRRFWWFCWLGVICIIIMQLSFLPRTSFSRDFRRWHRLKLTKSDVKRTFLFYTNIGHVTDGYSVEEHIDWWLGNLTAKSSKTSFNLLSDDNKDLYSYVLKQFKDFGFLTEVVENIIPNLQPPILSKVLLKEVLSGDTIYVAPTLEKGYNTPSYFGFGFNGNAEGEYVYANECFPLDFQTLLKNGIDVKRKIAICKLAQKEIISVAEVLQIAQHYGASGLLVYEDLADGLVRDRLLSAIHRDTVDYHSIFSFGNVSDIAIPSIPLSRLAIDPILQTLSSGNLTLAFKNWDYNPLVKPGTFKVAMSTTFDKKSNRKLKNIVGTIEGVLKDSEIVVGASRDSFTSSNPLSNHAVLFEIMRNYQNLVKSGWKPLRTIKFVSFDGSRNGLHGSKHYINNTYSSFFAKPILTYINVDTDAIRGDYFKVDANPLFNHILRQTAGYIPLPSSPKESLEKSLRSQVNSDGLQSPISIDQQTTLLHYWQKQDNITINNILGNQIKRGDSFLFENTLGVPTINVKFDTSVDQNSSYVPNSCFYSYKWLVKDKIDNDLLLHGLLIRYVGLLAISLAEKEVVDVGIRNYAKVIKDFYDSLLNSSHTATWLDKTVTSSLVKQFGIYTDLTNQGIEDIHFSDVLMALSSLIDDTIKVSAIFDDYIVDIQNQFFQDFAWYRLLNKIRIFAQFKYANYKALRLNSELILKSSDYDYLGHSNELKVLGHVIYGLPAFYPTALESRFLSRDSHSIFPHVYDAFASNDFELAVKWLVVTYEKLRNLKNKLA